MDEENNVEENNVNFATVKELEELIDEFQKREYVDCDCGISRGFDGDYDDLLELLYQAEKTYINSKIEYERQESKTWLDTNWEEILPNKKPTETDKKMYVKKSLAGLKDSRDTNKAKYENLKRMYDLALKYSLEVLR